MGWLDFLWNFFASFAWTETKQGRMLVVGCANAGKN